MSIARDFAEDTVRYPKQYPSYALSSGLPLLEPGVIDSLARHGLSFHPLANIKVILDVPVGFALRELEQRPGASRVVVTWNSCPEYCIDLLSLQADVLVARCHELDDIADAVRSAANGQPTTSQLQLQTPLTFVERRVLLLLAHGFSNQEIADELVLRHQTVRNTLTTIYEKMHLKGRSEAILYYWGVLPRIASDPQLPHK